MKNEANIIGNITKESTLDSSKITLFCGIAGAAKSSLVYEELGRKGLKYTGFTPTNRL